MERQEVELYKLLREVYGDDLPDKVSTLKWLKGQAVRRKRAREAVDEDLTVSKEDAGKLKKEFYDNGYTLGRDGLWHHMKTVYGEDAAPSRRATMKWLKRQKVQQVFAGTRKGGLTNFFRPKSPFDSISADLIDFNYKPSNHGGGTPKRYILVVIDNFSRKMFPQAITAKTAVSTSAGMKKVIEQIKREHGDEAIAKIRYIGTDDGPEFKGAFDEYLNSLSIPRRRSLGGHPQQQGLVERSNGKLKMTLAKLIKIKGSNWGKWLPKATEVYNNQLIRTTGFTPNEAMALPQDQWKRLIDNVKGGQDKNVAVSKNKFKVGDEVRIKLTKGKLGKSSTPNWSADVFTIADIKSNRNPQISDKYLIKDKPQDQLYSKNDLQKVIATDDIPDVRAADREEGDEQLRIDEDSLVEGAFTEEALQAEAREAAKRQPDDFEDGAAQTRRQNTRLRERGTRTRAAPTRLNPSTDFKSDAEKRRQERVEESDLRKKDRIIQVLEHKTEPGNKTEYLLKWSRSFTKGKKDDTSYETLKNVQEFDEVVMRLNNGEDPDKYLGGVNKIDQYQKDAKTKDKKAKFYDTRALRKD